MKKLILAAIVLTNAASVFSQGLVSFLSRNSLATTHVYAPLSSNPYLAKIGNGSSDFPSGTVDWTGFTPIGANGLGGQFGGTNTLAELLGAPGYNQPESSLLPSNPTTTFRTSGGGGFIAAVISTLQGVPANAPQATLEVVAWDNSSGLYSTWALASVAWQQGQIAAGKSGTWNQNDIGGDVNSPPLPYNTQLPNQRLQSFNLFYISIIPEPSCVALLALGCTTLLVMRRRR